MELMNIPRGKSPLATLALASAACLLVVSIVVYPKQAFEASLHGLTIWWNIVFPGLLPFLILSEMLTGFGMMHFWGVLLDPFMRACFRLPGVSGWAVAMGAAAGYAAAAQSTARLRERNLISRRDGNRLLALSYSCSPVVIIGVVAAGFFGEPRLGWALVAVHFAAWLAVGLILRAVPDANSRTSKPSGPPAPSSATPRSASSSVLRRALSAMHQARKEDGRSFGKLLGDAVLQSIAALMMIGGYMLFFSVLLEILRMIGLIPAMLRMAEAVLPATGELAGAAGALVTGLFELHLGTYAASRISLTPALQLALAGAILAWGGFAAHAQVKSLVGDTDLSLRWFVAARLLHGLLAFALTIACWKPLLSRFTANGPDALPGAPPVPGRELPMVPDTGWLAPAAAAVPGSSAGIWQLWLDGLMWGCSALVLFAGLSIWYARRRAD
jgi:sporulation integral membrane protein YlbJ